MPVILWRSEVTARGTMAMMADELINWSSLTDNNDNDDRDDDDDG